MQYTNTYIQNLLEIKLAYFLGRYRYKTILFMRAILKLFFDIIMAMRTVRIVSACLLIL